MSFKVKTIKKGQIDPYQFVTKRTNIDVNKEQLDAWIKSVFVSNTTPVEEDDCPVINKPEKTFAISNGKFEFYENHIFPDFIVNAVTIAKQLHGLKKEVTNYKLWVYPPCKTEKDGKYMTFNLPNASPEITRIVLVIGNSEMFEFVTGSGSLTGNGQLVCKNGESFCLPLGYSSKLQINFDNSLYADLPVKKGYKAGQKLEKHSNYRYIFVIDFNPNRTVIANYVKEKTKGNEGVFKKIINNFGVEEKPKEQDAFLNSLDCDKDAFLNSLDCVKECNNDLFLNSLEINPFQSDQPLTKEEE